MLRDLSNGDGNCNIFTLIGSTENQGNAGVKLDEDIAMEPVEEDPIDSILSDHKKFLDDNKLRDEKRTFDLLKVITNIHESKYYYHNVKTLLPQVWKTFSKEEKSYLAQWIINFFKNYIKFLQNQKKKISLEFEGFPNELLEIFQQLEPQIVPGQELLLKVAPKYNCWVNCILLIEQQLKVVPDYDKYVLFLNDLYSTLGQDDYYVNKTNTKCLKKAQSYSQFRLWEEVNQEFNNALSELYRQDTVDVDLKYANEYDQKLWEELHSESIIQIGDLDRQKFFRINNTRNNGAFKAEFQKWMVLGQGQPTYQVFESNREKLCQEWTSLPRFIDQVHYNRLTRFQENVELNEIMALLHNWRGKNKSNTLKNFFTATAIQRDRVPIKCESNKVWKDILENRYLPLTILNSSVESKRRVPNEPVN